MNEDEVVKGLKAGHETEQEAEQRVADEMQKLLADNNMALNVTIIKVPMQVAPGEFVFVDRPHVEIKRKKSNLIVPGMDAATKKVAMELLNGGKK